MNGALAAAIELGKQGIPCFPCRETKAPACPHGFKDASTDPTELNDLWKRFPGPLVGAVTGQVSHLAVLDIDAKHPQAHSWWTANRNRLLPTRVHRTRSGGLHVLYAIDADDLLKCSTSRFAKGVDVRADGGYVVWWPAARSPVLSVEPMTPWPEWLEQQSVPMIVPIVHKFMNSRAPRARLEGVIHFVLGAPEGERNRRLFWAACTVGKALAAREIGPGEHAEAIEALHLAASDCGLPHPEIARTILSAQRRCA